MNWIITFQARNYKTIQQILYRMNRMCVQAGFGGSLKPRRHEQRLLRNMGVHKVRVMCHDWVTWGSTRYVPLLALSDIWIAINSPWHSHNDNINLNRVPPGGPGPASNTLWCQRRREDERVNEAGSSVSPELLSREPEQPGQWPPPAQLYWRLFMFTSMILSCYPGLGAASQTFRAFHEPRPARGEDHVCNISGQFAKKIK